MKPILILAFSGLLAFGLSACGEKEASQPASQAAVARQTSDPAKAVEAMAAKLRENNVLEAIQLAVPPAQLDEVRAKFKEAMSKEAPSEEDRKAYAEQMTQLTGPDAETALYALLEPQLVKFETEMAAQMPMMVGMGQGFVIQSIQASTELNEVQKKEATEAIGAIAGWLQSAKLTDRELAKKGIAIVVKTARSLDLATLDQVRALDFDHAMGKAGIAFGGLKDILALYGLDLNQSLASTKASVTTKGEGTATVSVAYSLLGKPMTSQSDMVEVDGRWYGKDTAEQITKSLAVEAEEPQVADQAESTDAAAAPAQEEAAPEQAPQQ